MKNRPRLLLPYIFVSILWVLPLTSFVVDIDSEYVFNKFVLGKSPAQLWYLLMLLDVFVLFFPLRRLIEKSNIFYLVIPVLFYLGGRFGDISCNYFQFFTSLRYLSFFAIGHLIYKYRKMLFTQGKHNLHSPLILCLLAVMHVVAYILYLQNIPGMKTLLMMYLNFGGCITAMSILLYIGEKVNHENKLMVTLKGNSFAVYLLHQQIIYYTLLFLNGLVCPILHAAINFVVSLIMSLSLSVILRKSKYVRIYLLGEIK